MKKNKVFIGLAALLATAVLVLYVLNPSGTASKDPRARVVGHTLFSIPASSMEPTVLRGDYILVKTFAYSQIPPQRGDIIVFRYPPNPKQSYIKRVIGVGGDEISIQDHKLTLNGKLLQERYTQHTSHSRQGRAQSWQVPEGHLFVLGDNRDNSADSRFWGFVANKQVVGKVHSVIYSPSDNTGKVEHWNERMRDSLNNFN